MRRILLLPLFFLSACSQYPNTKSLCEGEVSSFGKVNFSDVHDEIGMSLQNDVINFSGSSLLTGRNIKVCKIGSIEFAQKDEAFFDTSGCTMEGKIGKRTYGTYNFITKKLHISNEDWLGSDLLLQGTFTCKESN
ncbi:MAG: hypothetical protein WCF09_11835 [Gallionella sp.]